jgi:hypothetical protein
MFSSDEAGLTRMGPLSSIDTTSKENKQLQQGFREFAGLSFAWKFLKIFTDTQKVKNSFNHQGKYVANNLKQRQRCELPVIIVISKLKKQRW